MATIIRRFPRRRGGLWLWLPVLALLAAAVVLWCAWRAGGPQPLHEISMAIPAPSVPAAASAASLAK